MSIGKFTRIARTCKNCGEAFWASASDVRRGWALFCCKACKNEWQIEHPCRPAAPLAQRFWKYVGPATETGCRLWTGSKNQDGYGMLLVGRRGRGAHRIAWELINGPVPKDKQVLHNCPGGDNPACVAIAHLWLGTQVDNMADAAAKGRMCRKLSPKEVLEIRSQYAAGGISQHDLGLLYGVTQGAIWHVLNRKALVRI